MKIDHVLKEYDYNPEEDSKATETYQRLKREVGVMYADAFWRMWRRTGNVNAALNMTQEEYDKMVRYESVEELDTESLEELDAKDDIVKPIGALTGGVGGTMVGGAIGMPGVGAVAGALAGNKIAEILAIGMGEVWNTKSAKWKRNAINKVKQYFGESMKKEEVKEAMSDAYGMPSNDNLEGSVEYRQHKNNDKGSVSIEASAESMSDLHDILKLAGVDVAVDLNKSDDAHDHEEPVEIEVSPPKEELLMPQKDDDDEEESPCGSSDDNVSYETDKEILVNYIKDQLKKRLS
tara:strand:- start:1174 stop:2049 length:876 start_codon:yes stop_codon:yes gene_type:complete